MRQQTARLLNLVVVIALVLMAIGPAPVSAMSAQPAAAAPVVPQEAQPTQSWGDFIVSEPSVPADTTGLSPVPPPTPYQGQVEDQPSFELPKADRLNNAPHETDTALQPDAPSGVMPPPLTSWDGIPNTGVQPPDTDGQVGPNHYVQIVNSGGEGSHIRIWDKSGNQLYDFGMNGMWPAGDRCNTYGYGDPVVLYDQLANRWILTQFIYPPTGPYSECFAVSKTGTPTNNPNDWWLYNFVTHATNFPDYPKIGVWPDGYYMMVHQFANASTWAGTGVYVFDRDKMLNGQPATFQYKDLYGINPNYGGMLPSNLMGSTLPPAGAPNYFTEVDQDWSGTNDVMTVFAFHTDWATPANTTFSVVGEFVVAPFDMDLCSASRERCIDQPGRPLSLEAISDRLMMHLWYRNFGDREVLVVNHTVDADGAGHAGIRWYELRKTTSAPTAWSLYQQGTHFPSSDHRWMGSIAMDHVGNMALGYSVSSLSTYPSIRYAGRLAGDPLGTLPQTENSLVEGGGSFSGYRWGDYSAMSVDPVDDCTFWYTQEYVKTGETSWSTRVGSFKFPNCVLGPQGILTGQVTNASTSNPIANASIQATASITQGGGTTTGAGGNYTLNLLVGTYIVTATAYGYLPSSATGVAISQNVTTTRNFALTPAPTYVVSGTVADALTGWPLYARITIDGYPGAPVWTNPATGFYSVTLVGGASYTFNATAFSAGYLPASSAVGPLNANMTLNIGLNVNATACVAPGYAINVTGLSEKFDSVSAPALPAGWAYTVVTNTTTAPLWATNAGTRFPSGQPAHSAPNVAYFNSFSSGAGAAARLHYTTNVNMGTLPTSTLSLWMYHDTGYPTSNDRVQVQVSTNGGTTWENVSTPISRYTGKVGWEEHLVSLSAYATQTLRLGFLGISQYGNDVHIDDILLGTAPCLPKTGGLVVGTVIDGNSGGGLLNAKVENQAGYNVLTVDTPTDPNEPVGFYTLFSPAGTQVFTATKSQYGPSVASVSVPLSGTVRQNFTLYSGRLVYTPAAIDVTFMSGLSTTLPVTVSNIGLATALFEIEESDQGGVPYIPTGPRPPYKARIEPYSAPEEVNTSVIKPPASGPVIPNTWGTGASIPTGARYRSAGTTCTGKELYVFGGQNSGGTVLNESWKYDSQTNAWTALAAMPTSLMSMEAACYQGLIYLVGGYTGSAHTNSFLIYNTSTNAWTTSTWPATRTPMTAIHGTKLYALGGNPGPSSEVRAYDILAGTWSGPLASLPTATAYGAAVIAGNYIYVVGGADAAGAVSAVQRYDPTANTWAAGPALPNGRMNPTTAWYGNRLYIAGGGGSGGDIWTSYNNTFYYDLSTWPGGSWTNQGETIPTPALATAHDCINNRIYGAAGTSAGAYYALLQYLDDGQTCHVGGASANVPWITEVPISGTVAPAGTQIVNVTVDSASVLPGIYRAALKFNNNTPYPLPNLPVTMTVTVPPTWGKLTGNVSTLGYCDATPAGLKNVTVTIQSALTTWAIRTDNNGDYSQWIDVSNNPLTVTVAPVGYTSNQVTGVNVVGQGTTTQDFALRWLHPCVSVSPPAYTVTLNLGQTTSRVLRTNNNGGATAVYSMTEENISSPAAAAQVLLQPAVRSDAFSASSVGHSTPAAPWAPNGDVNLVVDDGSAENSIGLTAGGQFVWLNRFTPAAGSYPFTLKQVQVLFPTTTPTGSAMQIVVWEDKDGDGNPGTNAHFLYSQNVTVQSNTGTTWNVYNLTTPVQLTGPGDVLIGLVNRGATAVGQFPASIDQTATQRRSWIGLYSAGAPPDPPTLPADSAWGIIDDVGGSALAGNWTLRGVGQTGGAGGDVVWLTESPISGTIPSDTFVNTTIGFNANAVALPGTYKANVNVNSNDTVNPVRQSAMTMIVTAPANWGVLTGTISSLGHCDVNPVPLGGATLVLQGTSGPTRTVTTDGAGRYTIWLNSLTGPYGMTVTAAKHLSNSASGIVIGNLGAVTNQDLSLRSLEPCLTYAPPRMSVTLPWGGTITETLTLTNTGAASAAFTVTEQAGGFIPLSPLANPILVVSIDASATRAFTTALTSLGYSYAVTTGTAFNALAVPTLLSYDAVVFAGNATSTYHAKIAAYLDAGGRFLVADNDFAFSNGSTGFFRGYFEANYGTDAGSDGPITGVDIMAGINTDISSDPFPDNFTITGTNAVGIFANTSPRTGWAGEHVARNDYRAIYLAWDFYHAGGSTIGDPIETTILQKSLTWLLGDVPWLSENPTSGSVAADGGTQNIAVNFNAAVPEVTQPGTYHAALKIKNTDTAAGSLTIPVTMTVQPAGTQGKLNGVINGLGYCDVNPAPLNSAAVFIQGSGGYSITINTDAAGYYQQWVNTANNPFTITVSAANHVSNVAYAAASNGVTTTTNVNLRWSRPCVNATPSSVAVNLTMGLSATLPVSVVNTGAVSTTFNLREAAGGFIPLKPGEPNASGGPDPFGYTFKDSTETGGPTYNWIDATSGTPLTLTDDSEATIASPFPIPFYGGNATNLRVGNNGAALYNATTGDVSNVNAAITSAPNNFIAPFWDDIDADTGNVFWMVVGSAPNRMLVVEWYNRPHFSNVGSATFEMILHENGNIVYQYQDVDFGNSSYNNGASATVGIRGPDAANSLQYSYNTAVLTNSLAICFAYPGLRADCSGADVLDWLAENPTSGSLAADTGTQPVMVTFDAGAPSITQPGTYYAKVNVASSDPQKPTFGVPVTMTVQPPATWAKFDGTVYNLAACDVNPTVANNASVYVQTSTGLTYTLATNAGGKYQIWMAAANSPLTLTVSSLNHVTQVLTGISAAAGTTTTTNVNLRLNAPCLQNTPNALSAAQAAGQQSTQVLSITNTGAAPLNWNLAERPALAAQQQLPYEKFAPAENVPTDARSIAGGAAGYSDSIYAPDPQAVLLTEGFESNTMPPAGWTRVVSNTAFTWKIQTLPHSGTYAADVEYDPALATQSEWLLSPQLVMVSGTLSFWSQGSVYWCRDTYDNCDLNVWLVVGDIGGGDDVYVGKGETVWPANWTYAQSVFNLTSLLPAGAFRIGFQYAGRDGAQIVLDDILVDGQAGALCIPNALPWVSASPISGTTAAGGVSPVNVTFDSTGLLPGTYTGRLCVNSNDLVRPSFEVPVTLTVASQMTFVYHDLENAVQPGQAIFVAGDFNSWNTTANMMTPNADSSVFTLTLSTLVTGTFGYKYVVYTDTAHTGPAHWDWLNSANRSIVVGGDVTAHDYRNVTIAYYALTSPAATTTTVNVGTAPIYGQIWAQQFTEEAGAPPALNAQVGFGTAVDPVTWAGWNAMTWHSQVGNNDQFVGSVVPTATGVYSYVVRFNPNWGVGNPNSQWYYGDTDGNPFNINQAGILTVLAGTRYIYLPLISR